MLLDIFGLVVTLGGILISVALGFWVRERNHDAGDEMIMISLQYLFLYLFQLTMMSMKCYYGFKWFCGGRTRKLYKQYYYVSVTLAGSALPMCSLVSIVCFSAKNYPQAIAQACAVPWCIIEIALV